MISFIDNLPTLGRKHSRTMQLLLTGFIIAMALIMALLASSAFALGRQKIALVFIFPPLAVFGWLLLTKKFEFVVMALPLLAMIAPFDLPTGTESKLPIVLITTLALGAIWFGTMIIRGYWHMQPSPLNKPALFFGIVCLLAYIWSSIWRDPVINLSLFGRFEIVQIGSLLTYYASLLTLVLIGNYAHTEARLKYIVIAFLVLGMLMTLLQVAKINHNFLTDRGLWGLWFVVPAFCFIFAEKPPRWYWRLLLLLGIALNIYQTFWVNLQWKSGWVPTVIGILIAILIRSRRWFVIALIAIGIIAFANQSFIADMTRSEEEEGADQRISIWEINLKLIRDHWLLGTGPAGYAVYYMTYWPTDARSSHNNYLDIIAQFGVLGVFSWVWLAFIGTFEGLRLYLRAPPGFFKTLAWMTTSGWLAAQASMMLGDWVLPFAYNQTIAGYKYTVYSWIFLGTLIALRPLIEAQRVRSEEQSQP